MSDVIDVKDLGTGVMGGVECDHFAFRKKEVDFQIWIAQGARPYPCRYVITSKLVAGAPEYSVQVGDWKTGLDAATGAAIEHGDWAGLGLDQACGFLPVAGLLVEAERRGLEVRQLSMCNSGDTAGSRDRVVGYGAWMFTQTAP